MAEFCSCNGTILNTGVPNKQRVINSGVKLFVVPMKADDGNINAIANTDTIDQTFLDGKISNADPSKRWYPIGEFKNQEDVRGDAISESFTDGSSSITQQGVRTYTGWLLDYSPKYLENLKSFKCSEFGIYTVNSCGAIAGSISKDETLLKPVRVNKGSWNPTYVKGTPTVGAKIQLMFEFSQLEKDQYLREISESEITADVLGAEGLLELSASLDGAATTTGFVIDLKVDYDIFLDASKTKVPGWVLADFVLNNDTTGLPVVITSAPESPEAKYSFVIPAQSINDVVTLTNDLAQKPGFNLSYTFTITA